MCCNSTAIHKIKKRTILSVSEKTVMKWFSNARGVQFFYSINSLSTKSKIVYIFSFSVKNLKKLKKTAFVLSVLSFKVK